MYAPSWPCLSSRRAKKGRVLGSAALRKRADGFRRRRKSPLSFSPELRPALRLAASAAAALPPAPVSATAQSYRVANMRPALLLAASAAAALLPAPASAAAAQSYRFAGGYIPAGGDVGSLPPGATVAAAEAACDALEACAGFTFDGGSTSRRGPAPGTTYLKNASAAAGLIPDPTSNWTTFLKAEGPCDILLAAGTPCVAAFSVARALYGAYPGALYQLNRTRDGALLDVGTLPDSGGVADAAAHAAFCAGEGGGCTVSRLYDQSPQGNHLGVALSRAGVADKPVNASRFPSVVNGFPVFAAYFEGGQGYRNDTTAGVVTGNDEETIYYVVDGSHYNSGCCFDFGNAESRGGDDGDGTMESVYWGNGAGWTHGFGAGPWVGADLENGALFAWGGAHPLPLNPPPNSPTRVAVPLLANQESTTARTSATRTTCRFGTRSSLPCSRAARTASRSRPATRPRGS